MFDRKREYMMEEIKKKLFDRKVILSIALVFVALLSFFVISKIVTNPDFFAATIKSLENKKVVVMKLAAASAASSTALTLIPGDIATPIANQIAGLSTYFIVVLCAIVLEKTLITTVGYVAFTWIIPGACISGLIYLLSKQDVFRIFAIKLAIFGIVLFAAIPISVNISDMIYKTHQESIEQTVIKTEQNTKDIENKKQDLSDKDKNWMEKIGGYISNLTSSITTGISDIVKKGENTLSTLLDTVAVLIITTCVIPIAVILIFMWVIKILFGFDLISKSGQYMKKNTHIS